MTLNVDHQNVSWSAFLNEQTKTGTSATDLFIKMTAVIIGVDKHITSEYCTTESPYNNITSSWNDVECHISPTLHFQSLLPLGKLTS